MSDLMNAFRDITGRFASDTVGKFRTDRLERRARTAHQSWKDFFRDLGVRFLIAGIIVSVAAALLWVFVR